MYASVYGGQKTTPVFFLSSIYSFFWGGGLSFAWKFSIRIDWLVSKLQRTTHTLLHLQCWDFNVTIYLFVLMIWDGIYPGNCLGSDHELSVKWILGKYNLFWPHEFLSPWRKDRTTKPDLFCHPPTTDSNSRVEKTQDKGASKKLWFTPQVISLLHYYPLPTSISALASSESGI